MPSRFEMLTGSPIDSGVAPILNQGRPLKIIQIFNRYLQAGGEEKSVARIATHLEQGGYAVHRFWRASAEWTGSKSPLRVTQPYLIWRNRAVLDSLRKLHQDTQADVWLIHNVLPVISINTYRLANTLKVPIIHWLHNYRPISPSGTLVAGETRLRPDDPLIALRESWHGTYNGRLATSWLCACYRLARWRGDFAQVKAWVALSEYMKAQFDRARWNVGTVFVLRHAWEINPPPATAADAGYFLFMGRMVETKGPKFLVDLWQDPRLRPYRLVMAGDGPLLNRLRANCPPNISWVGHVEGEQKRELVENCRAVLFPSQWAEPLGIVVYEAYDAKKPVVASDLGGLRETIFHGSTGFLLPATDLQLWRDTILRLAGDRKLAEELGARGRIWLEGEASSRAWLRGFRAVVQETIQGQHSAFSGSRISGSD